MAADYTTTALLAAVRRRAMLPAGGPTLADADILAIATAELQSTVASLLLDLRQEYLVASQTFTVSAASNAIELPYRAIGGVIRDVKFQDGAVWRSFNRIEPEREEDMIAGYEIRDNTILIQNLQTDSLQAMLLYFRRPNALIVAAGIVGTVSAINTTTGVVTITGSQPSTTGKYDFIRSLPPFKSLGDDVVPTATGAGTMTVSTTLAATLQVGDYLCNATESPVPQIPAEAHHLLVRLTVARCLEAIGDPKVQISEGSAEKEASRLVRLLADRGQGKARVIINRNGPGFLRGVRRFRF